ncbi:unnamed protein product [Adineta steineri]|uniref:Uncharacterized protein n=1 Tax=Adineta steineri TaxID=433720 RepID=A0A818QAB9_9BILA|nr:unnamed protein product [Adineta steineri]CAF3637696.1 unnamed protein product [Adineta steineri]
MIEQIDLTAIENTENMLGAVPQAPDLVHHLTQKLIEKGKQNEKLIKEKEKLTKENLSLKQETNELKETFNKFRIDFSIMKQKLILIEHENVNIDVVKCLNGL